MRCIASAKKSCDCTADLHWALETTVSLARAAISGQLALSLNNFVGLWLAFPMTSKHSAEVSAANFSNSPYEFWPQSWLETG
jgi:hypothetical protein